MKTEQETRLRNIWKKFRQNCKNPNGKDAATYYGLEICSEWDCETGFSSFFTWAMSAGYQPGMCLIRIDKDKGYTPINCRFTTKDRVCVNRKNIRIVEYKGLEFSVEEFSRFIDMRSRKVLRLLNAGKTPEEIEAMRKDTDRYVFYGSERSPYSTEGSKPTQYKNRPRFYEYNGKMRTLTELAKMKGLTRKTLTNRLERGWSLEKALAAPSMGHGGKRVKGTCAGI